MPWFDSFDAAAGRFAGMEILYDEPMALHTTFRIGGPAKRVARPRSTEEAAALLTLAEAEGWPVLMLGNGSNLLAADSGLDALVIHSGRLDALERTGGRTIRAGAGVSLARLASFAQREGLGGLEFAHGIPGSLGGAVCMNAGAYGGEMSQVVRAVTAWFPGEGTVRLECDALEFGYRRSVFSRRSGVALEAELALEPGDGQAIRAEMEDLSRRRREKQPLELPSAGSVFKRPEGRFAGALIEGCGLKGLRVGGAQVSEKHAGFVVNTGSATCADVLELIGHIQERVLEETGVALEPEIRILS